MSAKARRADADVARDYDVRLWDGGDISIDVCDLLAYGAIDGVSDLRCNDELSRTEVRRACQDVANAIRALDALLVEVGE